MEKIENLRRLSDEEEKLPLVERKKIIRDRVAIFKKDLSYHKEEIYRVIDEIKYIIETSPENSPELLLETLTNIQYSNELTNEEIFLFTGAIDNYLLKHRSVEQYRTEYPDDADLFKVVFGAKPRGFVDVIKGPMTLHFRCSDPGDYVLALNYGAMASNEGVARAQSSGGAALGVTAIPELKGTITIENVSANGGFNKNILVDKKIILNIGGQFLNIEDIITDIRINSSSGKKWEILVSRLMIDDAEKQYRLEVVDFSGEPPHPIIQTLWIDQNRDTVALDGEDSQTNLVINLSVSEKLHVNPKNLTIIVQGLTPQDKTEIIYRKFEMRNIPDENFSAIIQKHEEQHQFNKLFKAIKEKGYIDDVIRKANAPFKDGEETADYLMHRFAIYFKDVLEIDESAKDEILAYYRSGSSPIEIFQTLSTSKLYDWNIIYKNYIDSIPDRVEGIIKNNPINSNITAYINKEKIKEHANEVVGKDYQEHLKLWTDTITMLENKNYNRNEILDILYSEPIEKWVALAKRAEVKIKS